MKASSLSDVAKLVDSRFTAIMNAPDEYKAALEAATNDPKAGPLLRDLFDSLMALHEFLCDAGG